MGSTIKSEIDSTPETVTFGRTLVDGEAIDEGLTFPKDSPTVELLTTATTPLFSNPQLGEYGAGLVTPEETDGTYTRGLGIFPPGADGPAEHIHPNYDETFEVVEGEFVIQLAGESRTLTAGESVTVETGGTSIRDTSHRRDLLDTLFLWSFHRRLIHHVLVALRTHPTHSKTDHAITSPFE